MSVLLGSSAASGTARQHEAGAASGAAELLEVEVLVVPVVLVILVVPVVLGAVSTKPMFLDLQDSADERSGEASLKDSVGTVHVGLMRTFLSDVILL